MIATIRSHWFRFFTLISLVACVVTVANSQHAGGVGGEPSPRLQVGSAGEIIGFAGGDASGQIITLIHAGKSAMTVYHITPTGEIRLKSSRPIESDFLLELNVTEPLPRDIQRMIDR